MQLFLSTAAIHYPKPSNSTRIEELAQHSEKMLNQQKLLKIYKCLKKDQMLEYNQIHSSKLNPPLPIAFNF